MPRLHSRINTTSRCVNTSLLSFFAAASTLIVKATFHADIIPHGIAVTRHVAPIALVLLGNGSVTGGLSPASKWHGLEGGFPDALQGANSPYPTVELAT